MYYLSLCWDTREFELGGVGRPENLSVQNLFRSMLNLWRDSEKVRARKKLRLHGALMGGEWSPDVCPAWTDARCRCKTHTGFQILRKETNAKFLMDNY